MDLQRSPPNSRIAGCNFDESDAAMYDDGDYSRRGMMPQGSSPDGRVRKGVPPGIASAAEVRSAQEQRSYANTASVGQPLPSAYGSMQADDGNYVLVNEKTAQAMTTVPVVLDTAGASTVSFAQALKAVMPKDTDPRHVMVKSIELCCNNACNDVPVSTSLTGFDKAPENSHAHFDHATGETNETAHLMVDGGEIGSTLIYHANADEIKEMESGDTMPVKLYTHDALKELEKESPSGGLDVRYNSPIFRAAANLNADIHNKITNISKNLKENADTPTCVHLEGANLSAYMRVREELIDRAAAATRMHSDISNIGVVVGPATGKRSKFVPHKLSNASQEELDAHFDKRREATISLKLRYYHEHDSSKGDAAASSSSS